MDAKSCSFTERSVVVCWICVCHRGQPDMTGIYSLGHLAVVNLIIRALISAIVSIVVEADLQGGEL